MWRGDVRGYVGATCEPREDRVMSVVYRIMAGKRTYIGRIGFAHDDVQDRNVAAVLARIGADHSVLGLQQSPHDLEYSRAADRLCSLDILTGKGCVTRLQEVASRGGDQTGYYADQIVVHVSRVAKSRGAGAHDG